jgi:MATE family multidrug resistance protein
MSSPVPPTLPRQLFHLAWPVLVAQAAVMANGLIDTLMAGRISPLDLAGVGIGASIYATVFVTTMGVLLALTPIVAHHFGAGRLAEIGADVRQSAWLAFALAVFGVTLLHWPEPFLALARPPAEVEAKVRAYLAGAAWSVPGILFFRVFYGLTTGIGRPRPVMVFNLLGLLLKVPLNFIFMYGALGFPALGGAGAGWSSAVVACCVATAAWLWCRHGGAYADYAIFGRFEWPRRAAIAEFLRQGVPTGASFLVDVTAFTFMALFIARLGTTASASHQIAVSVTVFVYMMPMALGHAAGVLVGQALGANDRARTRAAGFLGLKVGGSIGAVVAASIGLLAPQLAALYSPDPVVRSVATALLGIVACYHAADALQSVLAQVLRGYKRAGVPMAIYAVSLWGVGLGGGWLLGLGDWLGPPRGPAGFWLAATASLVLAGGALVMYFERVSRPATRPG